MIICGYSFHQARKNVRQRIWTKNKIKQHDTFSLSFHCLLNYYITIVYRYNHQHFGSKRISWDIFPYSLMSFLLLTFTFFQAKQYFSMTGSVSLEDWKQMKPFVWEWCSFTTVVWCPDKNIHTCIHTVGFFQFLSSKFTDKAIEEDNSPRRLGKPKPYAWI